MLGGVIPCEIGGGIDTVGLIAVDITYRRTRREIELIALGIIGRETLGADLIVLHATQVHYGILVVRDISIDGQTVTEVFAMTIEYHTADRELDTFVVGGTDVTELIPVAACRQTIFEDEVAGGVPIQVDTSAQTLVPETIVKTQVTSDRRFPFEVGVRCDELTATLAVDEYIVHVLHVVGGIVE